MEPLVLVVEAVLVGIQPVHLTQAVREGFLDLSPVLASVPVAPAPPASSLEAVVPVVRVEAAVLVVLAAENLRFVPEAT